MAIHRFRGGVQLIRDKLNHIVDESNQLAGLRGDEQFISVRKGPGGTTVALNINNVMARMPKGAIDYFPVTVIKDGGSAGDGSTQCSFTYTVMDILGNTMQKNAAGDAATGMTPMFNLRNDAGACTE